MNFDRYDQLQVWLGNVGDAFLNRVEKSQITSDENTKLLAAEIARSLNELASYISETLKATVDE